MAVSLYEIKFKETFDRKVLCTKSMSDKNMEVIKEAVEDLYYFEFVYGEWFVVGLLCIYNDGRLLCMVSGLSLDYWNDLSPSN